MSYAVLSPSGSVLKHFHGKSALAQAMAFAARKRGLELWECFAGEPCYRFPFIIPQGWR